VKKDSDLAHNLNGNFFINTHFWGNVKKMLQIAQNYCKFYVAMIN